MKAQKKVLSDGTIGYIPTKEVVDLSPYRKRIVLVLRKYLDTSELNYSIISHWILGTYLHGQFETYPILQYNARKQSGKTRALKLTSILSYGGDGNPIASPTETLLFRHNKTILAFDEMENISSKEKSSFKETLNTIYKRGSKIVRYKEAKNKEGMKEYVEEIFTPFYPVVMASIKGADDVLGDRAITPILQRSNKPQTQLIEDFSTNPEILSIKHALGTLNAGVPTNLFTKWNAFIQEEYSDPELNDFFQKVKDSGIRGRPLELFLPLFVVAYLSQDLEDFITKAHDYLKLLEGEFVDNVDDLLQDFIVKRHSDSREFINLSALLSEFRTSLESPEDWINSKWFGRALKRLGFVAAKRLINGCVQVKLSVQPDTNSTNPTNTINSINTTNSTKDSKKVELVELVDNIGVVDKVDSHIPGSSCVAVGASGSLCSYCSQSPAVTPKDTPMYCQDCAIKAGWSKDWEAKA